jgi:choline dehydrogenase-like flavoprotein
VLIDLDTLSETSDFQADLCIVGGGAAGITLALEMIASRKHILLLEGGGLIPTAQSQSLYQMDIVSPRFQPTTRSRLRYFGGSTNHWEGSVRTMDPIDFETRAWVANSGWPISHSELLPYYDRAFSYVETAPRQPDERPFLEHLGRFRDQFDAGGFSFRLSYHSPPTQFGVRYLDRLQAATNVTIATNANLMSINESSNRSSVESLTICNYKRRTATVRARFFVIALGGIENARALLLSDAVTPGGIGNENGLVGRYFMDHPVVKALTFYPTDDFIRSWNKGAAMYRSTPYNRYLEASEATLRRHQLPNSRISLVPAPQMRTSKGIESAHQIEKAISERRALPNILSHLGNILGDRDLIMEAWRRTRGDTPAKSRGDDYGGYLIEMMMEQRPDPENRIVLTDVRDSLGLRRGRVHWRVAEQDKDDLRRMVNLFAKSAGAQGLGIVRSWLELDDTDRTFTDLLSFGSHHMGSTRASHDPRRGVVDANQRVHGRANIYVAGSSVFPTGSHVPPTATIVATTIRLADHLKKWLS